MASFWEILNPANIPPQPPAPPQPGSPEWKVQQDAASKAILPQPAPVPAALPPLMPSQQVAQQPQAAVPPQATSPQVAPPPERVNAWKGFLDSLKDPNVLGPLQTFLATIAAPLRPGENLGARIGYASALMQMHKRMLEENAINEPLRRREQEAKIRNEELRGEEATARIGEINQRVGFNTRTEDARVQELKAKAEMAIKEQNLKAAQAAIEELKLLNYQEGEKVNNDYKRALTAQAWRNANAPYSVGAEKAKDTEKLSKAYADVERVLGMFEVETRMQPFKTTAEREAAFRAWLATQDRLTAESYARGRQLLLDAGQRLPRLAGRGESANVPDASTAPRGSLQNPITRDQLKGQPKTPQSSSSSTTSPSTATSSSAATIPGSPVPTTAEWRRREEATKPLRDQIARAEERVKYFSGRKGQEENLQHWREVLKDLQKKLSEVK